MSSDLISNRCCLNCASELSQLQQYVSCQKCALAVYCSFECWDFDQHHFQACQASSSFTDEPDVIQKIFNDINELKPTAPLTLLTYQEGITAAPLVLGYESKEGLPDQHQITMLQESSSREGIIKHANQRAHIQRISQLALEHLETHIVISVQRWEQGKAPEPEGKYMFSQGRFTHSGILLLKRPDTERKS